MRRFFASLATVATAVTLAGCNLDLSNPNNPTVSGALANPRAATSRMIVGVLSTYRTNRTDQIRAFGSFGRETYYMFITDGRFITGPLRDWRQNNSFDAGTQWAGRYGNYRNAYAALQIIDATTALSDEEKAGARGVLKTMIALDLLHVIEARGPIGAVVDMTDDVNAVNPIVSQDSTYSWITNKLDEALGDLNAAGASFYFPIYAGFGVGVPGANTPAGFAQFNRAIKARVEAKRGSIGCGAPCYTSALAAIAAAGFPATFDSTNRDNGYYTIYSTAAGDAPNTVAFTGSQGSDLYVHPLIDSIPGVALDNRFKRKIGSCPASTPRSEVGVSSAHRPCTYATTTTSIPIIRNEELLLLRAEAEWFTGNTAGAIADLATVRAQSGAVGGGTAAVKFPAPATNADFVSELLLQRTLSLYQEGQRFPDYRRFGRLTELGTLPQDVANGFNVATASVLPNQECDARARVGNPGGVPMSCPGGDAVPAPQ
jgi:hypothetical protein